MTWTGSLGARQKVVGLTLNWCVLHSMLWRSGVVLSRDAFVLILCRRAAIGPDRCGGGPKSLYEQCDSRCCSRSRARVSL